MTETDQWKGWGNT